MVDKQLLARIGVFWEFVGVGELIDHDSKNSNWRDWEVFVWVKQLHNARRGLCDE